MRTRTRLWRVLALLFAISLVATACGDDDDTAAEDTTTTAADDTTSSVPENTGDGVLKIGYLLPQTGQLSFLGPPMINGVKLAIEEINAAGGVLGKPVELVEADDGTDADVASTAADTLLAEGVDYIVGAAGSSISLAVLDKITGAGVPMCSPSNTGVQFTTIEDNDLYFRTAPPDNLQAQVLADLIVADGHSSVVVMGRSDEYGEGFANFLADELEALGAEVPETIIYDPEAGSYQAEAQQIAEASPDAVAIISYEEGAQVMTAAIAESVGPKDVAWYGADGIQSSSFWQSVDANDATAVQGVKGTAPTAAPEAGEDTFLQRLEAFAPGGDTIYAGYAYDCAVLAALGAAVSESDAPADIAGELIGVSGGGETCALVAECFEAIEAGTEVDYDGASGAIDFVEAGEPGAGSYDTWQFAADGSVEVIEDNIAVSAED